MKFSPLINLLFSSGLPAFGYRFERHDDDARAAMVASIVGGRGSTVSARPSVTMVEADAANCVYLITEPGHFAHPSIMKRALVTSPEGRSIEVSGLTAAPSETMATWMAQFEEQDAQMRRAGAH